jgi:hypothetical protein
MFGGATPALAGGTETAGFCGIATSGAGAATTGGAAWGAAAGGGAGAETWYSSILMIWSVGTPIFPPPSISRIVNFSPFSTLLTMIALPLTK